ncbi:MAG: UPF0182 family protein, partial [Bradyrhizobium sp.]
MAKEPVPSGPRWSGPPQGPHALWPPGARLRHWGPYLIAAILAVGTLLDIPSYLQKWLWMRQLGFLDIFWTLLTIQWGMFLLGFVFAFLFFWSNVRQALHTSSLQRGFIANHDDYGSPWSTIARRPGDLRPGLAWLRLAEIATSALIAWAFALAFSSNWDTYLRFRYGGTYGLADPLFGVDIGFYLFHLPFYELEQHFLGYLTFITLAAVVSIYAMVTSAQAAGGRIPGITRGAIRHTSALLFVLVAVAGWQFYLDRYNLLYSTLGVVYGAGYTADHVTRFALTFMLGVSIVSCALLVLNFFRPQVRAIVIGAIAYIALYSLS